MPASRGTRFVGRQTELGALRAELDGALRGEGRLVVLLGEPGIGKTRTATALTAEAHRRGAVVVWGRCHESEGAPAYWPWIQALTAYANERAAERPPEIGGLLAALRAGTGLSDAHEAPERARFELFDRVVTALAAAAGAQPLLVVLDDLHWADIGSLRLLEFVACELGSIPMLVLGTARTGEAAQRTDAGALLAAVARLGRGVPLTGLSPAEVRDLLTDRLGRAPEADLVEEVVALTDGNPFLVIEMLHLLAAARNDVGRPRSAPLALPPGVQALLRQRLDSLPASSRRLLEIAAVVGREFDLAPLAAVLGEPPDALLDRLAPPLDAGIVRPATGALRRYAFTHALMRETVYTLLTPRERSALHAAVGAALEAAGPRDDVERSALAHHFFAAAEGGDPAKAIRYACEAGERALDVLAFEEAVRQFERALAAASPAPDDALHLRLLAGLADAVHGAGDPARAEALGRDAIVVARRCGATAFAATVLQCAGVRAEFGVTDVEMNALLTEALEGLPSQPGALRARLMVRLAAGLTLQPGAEQRRRDLADDATAMARTLNDPATLSFVLARRLIGLLGPDTLAERLETTEEILSTRTSSRQAELGALIFRADDLAQRGDRTGLDQLLAVLEQKAQASRLPFFLWMAASFRTTMALLEGRFAEAEAQANEALVLGQRVQARTAVLYFSVQIFVLRGWQARFAEIEPFVEMSVTQTAAPTWRCALAEFYRMSGRPAEARREFEALAADDFASLPRDTMWLQGMYLLASTCAHLGDARRAAVLYEHLQPFAGRIAVAWPLIAAIGPIDQQLGILAAASEQYAAAERHLSDALAVAERMRGLPWQADIRHQMGRMLIQRNRRGDRERARALFDEAEAIAHPLRMTLLLDWIAEARATARQAVAARAVGADREPALGEGSRRGAVLSLVPRAAPPDAAPTPRNGAFRRDGSVWSLDFEGRTTRVRDMLGLAHIARLLGRPEQEVHVLDLAGGAESAPDASPAGDASDAGALLDAKARADYRTRLRDAREELDEAERLNDRGRAERVVAEIEFLTAELSRGFGLGGRARRAGTASERARVAVTRAIKYAIDRIGEHDPALAEHLRLAVRTGTFCAYVPPSRDRVTWTL